MVFSFENYPLVSIALSELAISFRAQNLILPKHSLVLEFKSAFENSPVLLILHSVHQTATHEFYIEFIRSVQNKFTLFDFAAY